MLVDTPAADHLFKVRYENETQYLLEDQAHNFHHTVAKPLFMSTRELWDIQKAVAFLTTRVKKLEKDDGKK